MTRSEWKQIEDEIELVMAKHGYSVSKRRGSYGESMLLQQLQRQK